MSIQIEICPQEGSSNQQFAVQPGGWNKQEPSVLVQLQPHFGFC